jgi:Transposase, Mutator family
LNGLSSNRSGFEYSPTHSSASSSVTFSIEDHAIVAASHHSSQEFISPQVFPIDFDPLRAIRSALGLAGCAPFLQGLIDRGLKTPRFCIIDGNARLHRAITLAWRTTKIQRCAVHKLRNILRKVPQHAHEEITADFHLIVYASGLDMARAARDAFARKWGKRCAGAGAVESLNEAGDDILTFYSFPKEK